MKSKAKSIHEQGGQTPVEREVFMFERHLLAENLIIIDSDAMTQQAALSELASKLLLANYVQESFLEAVLLREEVFPTGLPTSPIGVAIPHTDIEHVIAPAIAVSILRNPVKFKMMGDPDQQLDVQIIFMLAIKEPHMQIEVLEQLMECIQDGEKLSLLAHATDVISVMKVLSSIEVI